MSPSARISLGLVALTISILVSADALLGIFPDNQKKALVDARLQYCSSIATQLSSLAELDRPNSMRSSLVEAMSRNEEVLSAAMMTLSGDTLVRTRGHDEYWANANPERSTPTHVRLPIYSGPTQWGHVELAFKPLGKSGWLAWLDDPLYRLVLVTATAGFALYLLFMRRTLRYLDPNAVVPGRVRTALNQLVEGVMLVDADLQIVLANQAIADKLDTTADQLTGRSITDLPWGLPDGADYALPWEGARTAATKRTDIRLELHTPALGVRSLSANIAPVQDGGGKVRGLMLSFDDLSDVERINAELRQTVANLESAQAEIRRKNDELEILATRDPLTGALNRRAFFERLETEFELAARERLPLSCLMADIDHFKNVNDTYGHAAGDVVIKQMADVLTDNGSANSAVGRYGGEEFCVLLPGVTPEDAAAIADKLRLAFSELSTGGQSATDGKPITASFGVSAIACGATDAHAMVDQADQALYFSKTHGRNQVTQWQPDMRDHEAAA